MHLFWKFSYPSQHKRSSLVLRTTEGRKMPRRRCRVILFIILLLFTSSLSNSTLTDKTLQKYGYFISILKSFNNQLTNCLLLIFSLHLERGGRKRFHHLAWVWMVDSTIGIIGIFSNSWVLKIFYDERDNLISSVNTMTW